MLVASYQNVLQVTEASKRRQMFRLQFVTAMVILFALSFHDSINFP